MDHDKQIEEEERELIPGAGTLAQSQPLRLKERNATRNNQSTKRNFAPRSRSSSASWNRSMRARPTHVVQPARHTIRNLVLLFVVILIVAFVAGYLPRHRRELQLVAEADTHNEALPQVSVMTAVRAEGAAIWFCLAIFKR